MSHQRSSGGGLDLHGLTVAEALDRFVEQYNNRVKNGQGGAWTVVHGYGSSGEGGAIRQRLRAFLDRHADKLRFEAGELHGNPGSTWVYPKLRLPDRRERLALAIVAYCATPRSDEKVIREFIGEGGPQVKELLRSLVKQGQLKMVAKGARSQYQAC